MANIVITDQFYINYSIRNENYDPTTQSYTSKTRLGFATYYEDNVAFNKRKSTIDRWADSADAANTVDNVPRTGYTFGRNVTHGGNWNATTVNWRIVDPLGFELEINSGNLAQVLQHCTIDKGTILDECVWGWDKGNGSKIVLIPITSQVYQDAKKTSIRHFAEVIDIKEAQLGDMVEYKNGQMGLYFGRVNMLKVNKRIDLEEPLAQVTQESLHVLMMDDKRMYFMKTPKLVACSKSDKRYTQEEAEKYLNECYQGDDWHITGSGYSYYSGAFLTYDKKPKTTLSITEITPDEIRQGIRGDYQPGGHIYGHGHGRLMTDGNYLLEDAKGDRFLIVGPVHEVLGSGRRHTPTAEFYEGRLDDLELFVAPIDNDDYLTTNNGIKVKANPNFTSYARSYGGNGQSNPVIQDKRMLGEFVKFYKIIVSYKTMTTTLKY